MTSYTPKGVCSRQINIEVNGDTIESVQFVGGCNGNTQGISSLVKGMKVDEVIARLEGINCNGRGTSCPDQLAKALKSIKGEKNIIDWRRYRRSCYTKYRSFARP